ncbi:uncharacterized protein SPAPADRAFT_55609 [Spathaspora passalidarum NRRL Y-27907]|uniref:rRNA-processing protein FYV7 n=1 Tax=Spathaspora passalidarum (strain NRRL Y-27907 / 11-Y1) TaxID=619300 RepID=G3AP41_SPAPN|nr:uncharacterized protein SPAPADRAFT_55609 [Spathaspora passalidarum NRRL Y-27907]EGW32073.1 hypothetical protein SPAPADRAFT_55609 [Spathaspora passalidarum NRRL Y-27907]
MPADRKSSKKYTDRHASKTADIKRALVHRARIRKNYFKLLKEEGRPDPQETQQEQQQQVEPKKKPVNFAERAQLAKQRKEEARAQKLQQVKEKREKLELKKKEREMKKAGFSKHTRTGQPLMGPRINNLLDKIRNDMKEDK